MNTTNIIKFRRKNKLAQEALARKADISYNTLSKIETGLISDPRISTLIKIADALNVSLDELVGRNFKPSKSKP